MERPFLQSALRELQTFLRARRFWATFGAVVLIFWVTGPYGTSERLASAPRLGFWLVLNTVAWSIALTAIVIVNMLLKRKIPSLPGRMALGTLIAGRHVEKLVRAGSRLAILMKDGREGPVSRSRMEAVRTRWG